MSAHAVRIDEICPPPDAPPRAPKRFVLPKGAVDTHAHVIGPDYIPQRSYTPAPHPGSEYLAMLDAVGMTHGVLVQVSVHGTDNGVMLDVLRANRERLRGVAVAPVDLPDSGWRELQDAGVRGLRLMTIAGGGVGLDDLARYGAICKELGWHLQLFTDARKLEGIAPAIAKLPVPFVLDHMGNFQAADGLDSAAAKTVLGLVRDGGWVKLSGAFRLSAEPPYADVVPFARALLDAAPDRCVWGSDWPHVGFWGRMPNVGDLLDLVPDWAPDEAVRERIFVTNPHRLYGF